jgi:serine/threonine protein kinase
MGELPSTGTEFANYRLEALLGRGGMSVVYRAHHIRLSRKVALKFLDPQLARDESFRERFIRESKAAAAIDHPNIVPIYEAGEHEGLFFIAMRYVEGVDLKSLLEQSGRLDPAPTFSIIAQVGSALDAAHARGLVHRDVKPQNVLIVSGAGPEPRDHVYLTDFGLTRDTTSSAVLTAAGDFVGTIDYAAPEQIESRSLDRRTDIYSLGCLLYECLTGLVPFRRENEVAVMYAHLLEAPPSVRSERPDLSAGLDAVVARAMAKSKEERFGSCKEMVNALRSELSDGEAPSRDWDSGESTTTAPSRRARVPERGEDLQEVVTTGERSAAVGGTPSQQTVQRSRPSIAESPADEVIERKTVSVEAEPVKHARLLYKSGSAKESLCDLKEPSVTVGRDPQAEISVDDSSISWRHATFEPSGSEWFVFDLGSLNGTVLNGKRLAANQKGLLSPGAEIKLGRTTFIFLSSSRKKRQDLDTSTGPDQAESKGPPSPMRLTPRAPVATFLVVREGPGAGQTISLEALPVVVGGEGAPGIEGVQDPFVSARHLELERGPGGVQVKDLGSSNGTRLNGRSLGTGSPEMIQVGDELRLGPRTVLRVEAERSGPPAPVRKTWRAPVPRLLVVREGPGTGRTISLESLPLIIGTDDGPGRRGVNDPFVSASHVEVVRGPDGVQVKDLGSSNGTRLNGHPLRPDNLEMIQVGDELRLGTGTLLRVE